MRPVLLILIPGFAKNEDDTTCIPFAQSFIKAINRNYPEVEVIIITLDFPFTSASYSWFGNKVIPLNGSRILFRPLLWLKLYRALRKISKDRRIAGMLNLWCADNALVTHYFSKWNKQKHLTWLQGQDARKGNKALWFFKPGKEHLVALSDSLKASFERNYSISPAHIIYPGVDETEFLQEQKQRDIDVIGIGSLTELKQYEIFIDTIQKLCLVNKNTKAKLIGKGPQKEKLLQLIKEKGLEDNIELTGEMPHDKAIALLKRSKILLHPSSYEGYSIACLEALAAGCHVVSFVAAESEPVAHWHIVHSKTEMENTCCSILQLPGEDFSPVILRTMNDCAGKIMQLFGYASNTTLLTQPATSFIAE